MIGSLITRGLVMIFAYAYPAYECFKTVEKNKPEVEQLLFWCQYWILVALLTVCERIGDTFISWLPMYSEAKLAFYIYLWFPKTKGTTYVYDSFFKPYISKHEMEIDRNIMELRIRAGDMAVLYFQKAASYGQTRVFEILQYVAAQSAPTPTSRPRTEQHPPRATHKPAATSNHQPSAPPPAADGEPPSPTSSSQHQSDSEKEANSPPAPSSNPAPPRRLVSAPPNPSTTTLKKAAEQPNPEGSRTSSQMVVKEATMPKPTTENSGDVAENGPDPVQTEPEETAMEEAIRVTGARLRKTRSTAK